MAKSPPLYSKLTGRSGGVGSYTSLWLADDHLMILTSSGYSESYQRFQLRDIKGFFVTHSDLAQIAALIIGGLALILAVIAAVQWGDSAGPVWLVVAIAIGVVAVLALFFVRNRRVFLATGVQTLELASLSRPRLIRRTFDRILPLIEAAQLGATSVAAPTAAPASESAGEVPFASVVPERVDETLAPAAPFPQSLPPQS